MPFPPPPPPPPGPPPPPSFPTSAPTAVGNTEGRNLLLQSIRQGTSLKKTVTNDKSAPAISGSVRPGSSSSSNTSSSSGSGGGSPRSNGGINGSATLGRSNGLAGLFAGGMPRLKPTGVDIGQNNSQSLTSLPSATAPGQEQTRRQFNVDIKNRGPPPKPPPANQKPTMPQSTSDSVLTGPLHNRSSSTTSLNNNWTQPLPRVAMKAPPGGYGKPHVAPKPPGIAAKSPGKLTNGRSGVTRAQSMRAPRSPPVAPPPGQMSLLPNQIELYKGAPTFHQSQDSLLHTPPPPKHHTLPSPRAVPPNRPPLRPPQTKPPPPPPNKVMMSPPCPPPPPPTQAPPPPPHRVPHQTHRLPPVSASQSLAPPPPPARHSSMRNGLPSTFSSKLEARFAERFHMKEEFPPPPPFRAVTKVYNSKTAKQPAPQPPIIQLHWPNDNTSTC